jgi:hypothetical protein
MTNGIRTLYRVPTPYGYGHVEVYGDSDNAWYEWRIVNGACIEHDTRDKGYGSAEIALRDALIAATKEEPTIVAGDKIYSDRVGTRLCQMRDELTGLGFEATMFWRAPGRCREPVAYILAGESFADIQEARKSLIP